MFSTALLNFHFIHYYVQKCLFWYIIVYVVISWLYNGETGSRMALERQSGKFGMNTCGHVTLADEPTDGNEP